MPLRAIELFAGIGGFRLACDSLGISTVFANDMKAAACQVYADKFGDDELQIGDISDFISKVPPHDLLTGGFPCQPFSSAGKKNGIRDPRGTLFEKIIEILDIHRPRYFVLENVKRLLSMENGDHFATILDKLSSLGYVVEWRLLNAMHLGLSQNRQRVFITGIRTELIPTQLRLLNEIEIQNLSEASAKLLNHYSKWHSVVDHAAAFPEWGIAYKGRFCGANIPKVKDTQPFVPLRDILQKKVSDDFDFTESTLSRIDQNTLVERFVQGVEIISNQAGGARMGYTIFGTNGVAPTLTASSSRHYERYRIGNKYRRLTNIEYARIQGFPDNHCEAVSVYTQYELIGNAVPPSMVEWVLKRVMSKGLELATSTDIKQMDIFDYAE